MFCPVTDLTAQKMEDGRLEYNAVVDPNNLIHGVENGKYAHDHNGWVKSLQQADNPGRDFLIAACQRLDQVALGEEVDLASTEHSIRWVAGGGALIYEDQKGEQYIVLNCRAPGTYLRGCFDVNGGLSTMLPDMFQPDILSRREIFEEVVTIVDGILRLPEFPNNHSARYSLWHKGIYKPEKIENRQREIAEMILGRKVAAAPISISDITPEKYQAMVYIRCKGQCFAVSDAIVVIDPAIAAFELRYVLKMPITDISKLILIDGEAPYNNPDSTFNREMYLVPLPKLLDAFKSGEEKEIVPAAIFQSGQRLSERAILFGKDRITPCLSAILEALSSG